DHTYLVRNEANAWTFDPDLGHIIDVTGIIREDPSATTYKYRIQPRHNGDIVDHGILDGVGDSDPNRFSLSVNPNPSRSARVSFALPRGGQVELAVYDLAGRKLSTITSGRLPAGRYTKAWDGRDASGKQVHGGVFFYRLRL